MGLDTSHECWHGSYSTFSRWRKDIAEAAGYCVWPVTYDHGMKMDTIMLEWHRYGEKELLGEWDDTPPDPLIVLFAHSDCDGVIKPQQAKPLADSLEKLLPKISEDYTRKKTEQFIEGLREAVEKNENVKFH